MKSSYEKRVQNQFCAFCVKTLKNEAFTILRSYSRQRTKAKSLDELSSREQMQAATEDSYFMGEHVFAVLGKPIVVNGDDLAKALLQLSTGKRDVILMSFFLEMKDREIGECLNTTHQAISKRKKAGLKELQRILMKEGSE